MLAPTSTQAPLPPAILGQGADLIMGPMQRPTHTAGPATARPPHMGADVTIPISAQPSFHATMDPSEAALRARPVPQDANWNRPLFDCTEDPYTYLEASCCQSYTYAKNKAMFNEHKNGVDPTGKDWEMGDCCLHLSLQMCCMSWIPRLKLRSEIRRFYRIRDNLLSQCVAVTFPCCGPAQESQQLRDPIR